MCECWSEWRGKFHSLFTCENPFSCSRVCCCLTTELADWKEELRIMKSFAGFKRVEALASERLFRLFHRCLKWNRWVRLAISSYYLWLSSLIGSTWFMPENSRKDQLSQGWEMKIYQSNPLILAFTKSHSAGKWTKRFYRKSSSASSMATKEKLFITLIPFPPLLHPGLRWVILSLSILTELRWSA
jgi:hypothetical protein